MTYLLLIRHGENDVMARRLAGRMPGVHLNAKGRKQAETMAQALRHAPLKAIYASPLERAVETAIPVANLHGLEAVIAPELIEVDFGTWQGKTYKQLARMKLNKLVHEHPSQVTFPGGESLRSAQQRAWDFFIRTALQFGEQDALAFVTHGDIVRLAVAKALNMTLDDFHRLAAYPASVSVLVVEEKRTLVLQANQVAGWEWPE
jgi:probable phosphomutase (TIGR03848 family)